MAHADRTIRVLRGRHDQRSQPMRVRRSVVVFLAALVIWTAVSFFIFATISHAPCVGLGLTQAEVDAKVAACEHLRLPGDLVNQPIPVLGYLFIVGVGVAYATRGKREGSADQ
jgi:hypothetical protein